MLVLSSGQLTREVSKLAGEPVDQDEVLYAIRKAGIQPVGRAGIVRLFPESAVVAVRDFLAAKRRKTGTRKSEEPQTQAIGA